MLMKPSNSCVMDSACLCDHEIARKGTGDHKIQHLHQSFLSGHHCISDDIIVLAIKLFRDQPLGTAMKFVLTKLAPCEVRTHDLLITNETHYHYAKEAGC